MENKSSAVICYWLLLTFLRYGVPQNIKSEKHCPWQNGRIERFFKTSKEKLYFWEINKLE
jgi:hypothetical protein